MICHNCHKQITPGNPFCNHCGTKVATQPVQAAGQFCGNCGGQVPAGNNFCPHCGGAMNGQPRQQVQANQVQYQQQPQMQYQQPVKTQASYVAPQQVYMGQNQRHPSEYLNIKRIRTWSAVNILLSPILGIWAYMLVKQIETAANEMEARKLYKKATNICVVGTILGVIAIMIYSGM